MNILCMMRGENNLKVYYLALSLFLTFFFAHQITHVMCFGRYRDKKCKKKKFYFIYGFWVVFFGILCTMMGSASGVDHTFDYGMNSLELYLGKKNYFEGNVIYAEDDYKHNGDFILEYYVKNTEDIEIISKQIVEENVFIFRAYNLSDINVVWKSVDDELYVYGGDELYATIDVERKGLLSQSYTAMASGSSTITEQQLGVLFDGMESIVVQLEEMGLTEEDISDLFGVLPREDSFYHEIEPQSIEYNGTFVCEGSLLDVSPESSNTRSYNGNLPSSDVTQKERIENIYGIALQYYRTNYYEGSKVDGTAFGNYLSYLYLSHYIDGPGRAPTANDLPYIISTSDVSAYNQFLSSANLSNWANNLANLGSALYSDFDYMASLTSINSVDQLLSNGVNQVTMEAVNGYNTTKALITIAPLIKKYIVENHATAVDDVTLTDDTLEYVESQLSALNFYETFDKDITSAVISIVTTTFISAICSSISLMGVFVSVVPLFVYECTGLIQTAVLARLQYSFSGRYAVRTGIYIDNM